MTYGQTLIDKATQICGSRYRLSQLTGIPESNLSDVVNGKRDFPTNWLLRVATVANIDPGKALRRLEAERRAPH